MGILGKETEQNIARLVAVLERLEKLALNCRIEVRLEPKEKNNG